MSSKPLLTGVSLELLPDLSRIRLSPLNELIFGISATKDGLLEEFPLVAGGGGGIDPSRELVPSASSGPGPLRTGFKWNGDINTPHCLFNSKLRSKSSTWMVLCGPHPKLLHFDQMISSGFTYCCFTVNIVDLS